MAESGLLQIRDPLKPYGKPVGIDLGTTHSLVAYVDGAGKANAVPVDGNVLCPSVVHYYEDGSTVVGREAREPDNRGIAYDLGERRKVAFAHVTTVLAPRHPSPRASRVATTATTSPGTGPLRDRRWRARRSRARR